MKAGFQASDGPAGWTAPGMDSNNEIDTKLVQVCGKVQIVVNNSASDDNSTSDDDMGEILMVKADSDDDDEAEVTGSRTNKSNSAFSRTSMFFDYNELVTAKASSHDDEEAKITGSDEEPDQMLGPATAGKVDKPAKKTAEQKQKPLKPSLLTCYGFSGGASLGGQSSKKKLSKLSLLKIAALSNFGFTSTPAPIKHPYSEAFSNADENGQDDADTAMQEGPGVDAA